jgi:hypothetical protein
MRPKLAHYTNKLYRVDAKPSRACLTANPKGDPCVKEAPSSLYIKIHWCVYIYIVLYKYIIEVNKYMNINYFYRVLHFNIYEISLSGIIKTYLVLGTIL